MYKLEKLTDDVFEGKHPNGVFAGMSWVGFFIQKPKVNEKFYFGTKKDGHVVTSTVVEIVNEEVFKTKSSTYKLTKHESD